MRLELEQRQQDVDDWLHLEPLCHVLKLLRITTLLRILNNVVNRSCVDYLIVMVSLLALQGGGVTYQKLPNNVRPKVLCTLFIGSRLLSTV